MMSEREVQAAIMSPRDMYPERWPCAVCGQYWAAHNGEICPQCTICGKPPTRHGPAGARGANGAYLDVLDTGRVFPDGSHYVWTICRGGETRFLPMFGSNLEEV